MLLTIVITVIIILICVVLLSVSIIIRKGGKFPNTHIEGNRLMREKGIHCAAAQDYEDRSRKELKELLRL